MKSKKLFDVFDYDFETNKHIFVSDYHLSNPADQRHEFLSDQNDFDLFDCENSGGLKGRKNLASYPEKAHVIDIQADDLNSDSQWIELN